MSRIGKLPIAVPSGVTVTIDGSTVTVKGPKGELSRSFQPVISIKQEGDQIVCAPLDETREANAFHGLTRTLIANMVEGVSKGFSKKLQLVGVGYRAAKQGKQLVLTLGFSHQVFFEDNADITIDVPAPNKIIVHGPDKQKVGQFAAEIREKRPPEPYKGKGIKYVDEVIIRKEGKAGKGKK